MEKFCVYTAITGNYETLGEVLPPNEKNIPFICLTDNPDLRSDHWDVRYIPSFFSGDSMRNQRILKILPHKYLADFDCSLYIDNSVVLIKDPSQIFEGICKGNPVAFFLHSYRSSVYEEFIAVMKAGLDKVDRIFEQLSHYQESIYCDVLNEKPYWGGVIFRDHRDISVQYFSELWIAHVMRYARRDQLSLNYALRMSGISAHVIASDIKRSDFHQWPRLGINRLSKVKKSAFRRLVNKFYAAKLEICRKSFRKKNHQ